MCPYVYYKDENGRSYLFCKKSNDICPFSRFCRTQNKVIPTNSQDNCLLRTKKEVPEGCCNVRFEKKGKLYVDYEDRVIVVVNPYDIVPDYVKIGIRRKSGEFYVKKEKQ
jgi:hypothetical protein